MKLRPAVAQYAFDAQQFAGLRARVSGGSLDPAENRLHEPPQPLQRPPTDLVANREKGAPHRAELTALGEHALRAGRVAALILNGGMATRFGGGAKGIVPVLTDHPHASFMAIKLADICSRAAAIGGSIPVVMMHSFATEQASRAHLEAIGWAGIAPSDRHWFSQSIMPRVLPDGTPLQDLPEAEATDDTQLYAAPGHGDTLGRLRQSGVLAKLLDRGVEHVLVSNVDNVGASVDPLVVGAHLRAVESGAEVSVEVVRRRKGDAGGCVATLPGSSTPAIIEGFRLPESVDLTDYPHFNTNTLWIRARALNQDIALQWFAVRKEIEWPRCERAPEGKLEVVQFERLIGQITESVPSAYLEVDRDTRFLPIKTREELQQAADELEAFARRVGLVP